MVVTAEDADADGIVTTSMNAWANLTLVACATAQERSTSADVLTSPKATATAMATNSTPWACGRDCTADEDADGICDDVDDCVGALDACGVCNGPGEIYECGCADIPEGDCDCDGNQLDALGVCGGDCTADEDADGICDDVDDCVGALDACGVATAQERSTSADVLTSPKATATVMATNSTPWACGGDCTADEDADGICDDVDDCGCA